MTKPVIVADSISVEVDGRRILDSISFSIRECENVTILGPNGAGKTTLLKLVARLLEPTAGSIQLQDRPLGSFNSREIARTIGYVPQMGEKVSQCEVLEFVVLSRYAHATSWFGVVSERQVAKAREALDLAGVLELEARDISTLSGGERQKVLIASALAQEAPIMLLDEPTAFLDCRQQLQVVELLARIREERKITMISVFHDLNQGLAHADRIIALSKGCLLFNGVPARAIEGNIFAKVFNLGFHSIYNPASDSGYLVPYLPAAAPEGERQ